MCVCVCVCIKKLVYDMPGTVLSFAYPTRKTNTHIHTHTLTSAHREKSFRKWH